MNACIVNVVQLAMSDGLCHAQQEIVNSQAVPVTTWLVLQVPAMHPLQTPQGLLGQAPPLSPCRDPLKPVHSPQVSFTATTMWHCLHCCAAQMLA